MNAGANESNSVPVDVLPPLPKDAYEHSVTSPAGGSQPPLANYRSFYHPASGVVILALDWLAFGTDLFTGFVALPVMCVVSFLISFALVYLIQLKWSRDLVGPALGKAFLGAFLVGLPFPITGTMLGAAILALAGLPGHPKDVIHKLVSGPQKP
jgi:hypothetical protein